MQLHFSLFQFMTAAQHSFPITEAIKRYQGKKYVYKYNYRSNFSTQLDEVNNYKKYLGWYRTYFE